MKAESEALCKAAYARVDGAVDYLLNRVQGIA